MTDLKRNFHDLQKTGSIGVLALLFWLSTLSLAFGQGGSVQAKESVAVVFQKDAQIKAERKAEESEKRIGASAQEREFEEEDDAEESLCDSKAVLLKSEQKSVVLEEKEKKRRTIEDNRSVAEREKEVEKKPDKQTVPEPGQDYSVGKKIRLESENAQWMERLEKIKWAEHIRFVGQLTLWGRMSEPGKNNITGEVEFPGQFQIRFARLGVKINPYKKLAGKIVMAFDNKNTLFDYELTYKMAPYLQLSAGQWRMHMGGAVSTPSAYFVMMERPSYTAKMTKARFRDIGVRIQSAKRGILDGAINYRVSLMNGTGVTTVGPVNITNDMIELLLLGRLELDAAPLIFGPKMVNGKRVYTKKQMKLGGFMMATKDPAIADLPDGTHDKAASAQRLGRAWVPYWEKRATYLGGADLEVSLMNVWLLVEVMVLHSRGIDTQMTSVGLSLDVAYRVDSIFTQFAARVEYNNPLVGSLSGSDVVDVAAGFNFEPWKWVQLSAFVGANAQLAELLTGERPQMRLDTRVNFRY